jgi:hypothetical protein
MNTMKRTIVVSLALLMVLSAVAWADGIGAFSAFKNGVGARALAMGGAFVAVANDATAAVWNPAGLASLGDTRLTGMSTDLFGLGVTHQYIGATTSFSMIGVGLAWERASIAGQANDDEGAAGEAFSWVEQSIGASLATNVLDVAMVGANVKYYMADNDLGATASGFGFDLGLLVSLGDMFVIGVNAKDLAGSSLAWDSGATDTISGVYTAGLAMKLVDSKLILATDVDFDGASLGDTHVGVEFKVIDELALRGGVVLTNDFQDYYFSVGAGINVAGLYVDAAYVLEQDLGNTLVLSAEFSLGGLLGGGEEEPVAPEAPVTPAAPVGTEG